MSTNVCLVSLSCLVLKIDLCIRLRAKIYLYYIILIVPGPGLPLPPTSTGYRYRSTSTSFFWLLACGTTYNVQWVSYRYTLLLLLPYRLPVQGVRARTDYVPISIPIRLLSLSLSAAGAGPQKVHRVSYGVRRAR